MSALEIIKDAQRKDLTNEDGDPVILEMLPALSDDKIEEFARQLPCPIPPAVRELLRYCKGFLGAAAEPVDFTGRSCSFGMPEIFPHGVPIAADGYGNFWVVDLWPESKDFGPIYFACHDAPVILLQSPSLEHFLIELFKMSSPPHASLINDVHDDRIFHVWRKNPVAQSYDDCKGSSDPVLQEFAQSVGASYEVADLRNAKIGCGFSWGRYGPDLDIRRCGSLPIFAIKRKLTLLKKIFR